MTDLFAGSILERASLLFHELQYQDENSRIETINQLRAELHKYSPFSSEPVDCIVWKRADLYVASYQLHSTLDFREVIQIVQEIIINLVGAEAFVLLLLDEKTNELRTVAKEEEGKFVDLDKVTVKWGEGILGKVAKSGEAYYVNQDLEGGDITLDKPLAAVPLKIKEHVIGLIVIYSLLQQKDSFSAVDYELFSLLAAHAATAIFSSKLYSQSERKLNAIQSFFDLLTTT